MFCINCGAKIGENDAFCTNCGLKIEATNNPNTVNILDSDLKKQIENAKCVIEYDKNTLVDEMDTIKFGTYPQSDISGNKKESIEWLILEKRDDKAFLLSKLILDYKQFCEEELDIGWEDKECSLRKWLNLNFYENAFSDLEKNKLIAGDSVDIITCLSEEECESYLGKNEYRVYKYEKRMARCTDYSKNIEINGYKMTSANYWLRTRGARKFAKFVFSDGRMETTGKYVDDGGGVRPAIWVKI